MTKHHGQIIPVAPYGAPEVHESVWLAPGSFVVGNVSIGRDSSIWYNAVVRATPTPCASASARTRRTAS